MRELFMTTDNFGTTSMSMDEQFKTVAELGFSGIEHHFPATREMADCLKKYGLKMIHSEIPFNEDGTLDNLEILQEYLRLFHKHGKISYLQVSHFCS